MKKTFLAVLCLVLILAMCAALWGCSRQRKFTDAYFDYFDSYAELTVYTNSADSFDAYNEIFAHNVKIYHSLLDVYNEYDSTVNICTLNRDAANEPIRVSAELFDFLVRAKELHTLTGGYTSLTMGAVTSIWKQAITDKCLPDRQALAVAAEHTDINALILDENDMTVYFTDPQLQLDAGALAKGYVADVIAQKLKDAGCDSFLLNLGGTLYTHGQKPDGTSFSGGISYPDGLGRDGISVDISDKALSTSGSYYRGFELGGTLYHHIIDPTTLTPKNTFVSVSVLCPSGADADALSTALFSMSMADGRALIDSLDDTEAVWIFADGTTEHTDGITA